MFNFLKKNVLSRRDNLCFFKSNNSGMVLSSLVKFVSTDSTIQTIHFESSQSHLVVAFFKNSGFSDSDISKITRIVPELLRCRVDKTLKPKFEFFRSQGLTGPDIVKVVRRNPNVLKTSLVKKITPNIALLRAQGVPADNIATLLVNQPRAFMKPTSRFSEIVEEVKKMKFDPKQYLFLAAIHGLTCMSKSSLEAKFDVYRRWGLSEDELQLMFQKTPYCLMISEKNIMSTMNYFVNEMGFTPSMIVKCPAVLGRSLERRIIPRCSVIQILKAKGLVGDVRSPDSLLKCPEEVFLKRYVTKFEKEVPELLSTYQGKSR